MKRLLILLFIIAMLLASCESNPPVEVVPRCWIRIENKTDHAIYLNIRKATDPSSDDYEQLIRFNETLVYAEEETPYIVSYAVITGQKTTIKDGILETVKTVSPVQTIELTTEWLHTKITVTGTTDWEITEE